MRIDVMLIQHTNDYFVPQFQCTDIEDVERAYDGKDMPEIPMSRDGENCWTPVTYLQSHNGHSPKFKGPTIFSYLDRVKDALVASLMVEGNLDTIELHYGET